MMLQTVVRVIEDSKNLHVIGSFRFPLCLSFLLHVVSQGLQHQYGGNPCRREKEKARAGGTHLRSYDGVRFLFVYSSTLMP